MRILLIRLRQIGDVVFTTPAVAALRRRFPDAHLTYLVEPAAAPIVAANPHLDEVIVVPRRGGLAGLAADLALGWRLRCARYDLAIDFHGGPRAALLTRLSAAPTRIGYDVAARGWLYTRRVGRPPALRRRHSVRNQWDLLAPLEIGEPAPLDNPVEMPLDPRAARSIEARLRASGIMPEEEIAVIHVAASSPFRRWPVESFAETAAAIASRPGRRVIVTTSPSERAVAMQVIDLARQRLQAAERERVAAYADFSLPELRALLERSALFIGGDSGPLHVAATTRVPIVALFGPTPSERSAPWRDPASVVELVEVDGLACRPCDQRDCVPGDFRCLTGIEPARVIAASERILANLVRREQRHA